MTKTRRTNLNVESLGDRIMPASISVLGGKTLYIEGSLTASNQVQIDNHGLSSVKVTLTAGGVTQSKIISRAGLTHITALGGNKADLIVNNTSLSSYMYGRAGNDTLIGGSGRDWLYGGDNNDLLAGRGGKDVLMGDDGNDTLNGGSGDDEIWGGNGNDVLLGESGRDSLYGGAGDDWLDAGSASSTETVRGDGGYDHNAWVWAMDGTTADDVRQGGRGTCVFLSALSGAAGQGYNLAGRITYRGNFEYAVKLYNSETRRLETEVVKFNGTLTNLDTRQKVEGEFWVNLYERAYVQLAKRIDSGIFDADKLEAPKTAMYAITGRKIVDHNEDNMNATAPKIVTALRDGKIVTAGNADDTNLIHARHSYTVQRVWKNSAGQWMIELRNPWGYDSGHINTTTGVGYQGSPWDGVIEMTWRDFTHKHDFDRLTVS